MGRVLLAVDMLHAMVFTVGDQSRQGDFGCVRDPGKHGFTEHGFAYGNAVQASDQVALHPSFNAVRVTCLV